MSASDKGYKLLQPKDLTPENLPIDVHTWKWYFACGQRYLVVATGVRTKGYSRHKLRHTCMYRYSVNLHPTRTTPITHVDTPHHKQWHSSARVDRAMPWTCSHRVMRSLELCKSLDYINLSAWYVLLSLPTPLLPPPLSSPPCSSPSPPLPSIPTPFPTFFLPSCTPSSLRGLKWRAGTWEAAWALELFLASASTSLHRPSWTLK